MRGKRTWAAGSLGLGLVAFAGAVALMASDRGHFPAAAATPASAAQRQADEARSALARDPHTPHAQAQLAAAAVQLIRETGDGSWYEVADKAGAAALRDDPRDIEALDAMATLANSRHRFAEALAFTRRSLAAEPDRFGPRDMQTDALIELGRYREAFANAEGRLSLRPDTASYARASYAAELRGDSDRALALMRLALESSPPNTEGHAWTRVQLGLALLARGEIEAAEREMRGALSERPGFPRAIAGLGRVAAARGQLADARDLFDRANAASPFIEFAVLRLEVDHVLGDRAAVARGLAEVRELAAGETAAGVQIDLDMQAILADYRRPSAADVARTRRAHRLRPGVHGDQVLGWVLTRAGRCEEGYRFARRSLRLGTQDPLMHFQAGVAARCAGRPGDARRLVSRALAVNPRFSVRWAPHARRMLRELAR